MRRTGPVNRPHHVRLTLAFLACAVVGGLYFERAEHLVLNWALGAPGHTVRVAGR